MPEPAPCKTVTIALDDAVAAVCLMHAAQNQVNDLVVPQTSVQSDLQNIRRLSGSVTALAESALEKMGRAAESATVAATSASTAEHRLRDQLVRAGHVVPVVALVLTWAALFCTAAAAFKEKPLTPTTTELPAVPPTPTKVRTADGSDKLAAARTAHRARDYMIAAAEYALAREAGADPVTCLAGEAECLQRAGDHNGSLTACGRLLRTPGGAGMGRHVEGLVWKAKGDRERARAAFAAGAMAGCPYSDPELAALAKGE
jgi:hypothetical protein